MHVNLKHLVVAAAATGGIAAVAFGGSAVSTAFTEASSGTVQAQAATFSNDFKTGDISLSNAVPGDSSQPIDVTYTNNGSHSVALTISLAANGPAELAPYLHLLIDSKDYGALGNITDGKSYPLGTVAPNGGKVTFHNVELQLPSGTVNAAAGKSFDATYTMTATAGN